MTDPIALVRDLNADTIRDRLDTIEHERQALLVLLRAALRAHRDTSQKTSTTPAPAPTAKPKRKAVRS